MPWYCMFRKRHVLEFYIKAPDVENACIALIAIYYLSTALPLRVGSLMDSHTCSQSILNTMDTRCPLNLQPALVSLHSIYPSMSCPNTTSLAST